MAKWFLYRYATDRINDPNNDNKKGTWHRVDSETDTQFISGNRAYDKSDVEEVRESGGLLDSLYNFFRGK